MSKILIELDEGFLARIERERLVAERLSAVAATETKAAKAGKRPPRTQVMRTLLKEALDQRCTERGEEIPSADELADEALSYESKSVDEVSLTADASSALEIIRQDELDQELDTVLYK